MKLSSAVLTVIRRGALGGAVALAACSSQSSPIHREPAPPAAALTVTPNGVALPAARLTPLVAPPVAPAPAVVPPLAVAPPPPSVAPDSGAPTTLADAEDAGPRRHRRRHTTSVATQDPSVGVLGTLGTLGYTGNFQGNSAGCGRG